MNRQDHDVHAGSCAGLTGGELTGEHKVDNQHRRNHDGQRVKRDLAHGNLIFFIKEAVVRRIDNFLLRCQANIDKQTG